MGDGRKIMVVGGTSVDAATAVAMTKAHTGVVSMNPSEYLGTSPRDDAFDRLMRWDPRPSSVVIERVEMPPMPFLDRDRTWTHPKGPSKEKGPPKGKGRRR